MKNKADARHGITPPPTIDLKQIENPELETLIRQLMEQRSAFRGFLQKRLSDDFLAEDLLQQSFIKVVEKSHELKKVENAISWFYRILRNSVVDYYRSHASDNRKFEGLLQELVTTGEDHSPPLDEVRPTVCACLNLLLNNLRPAYADLIRQIDFDGKPMALVAKNLQVTPNNLTVRLHRARQALKASLEKTCGICTKHGCFNCTCT